MPKVSVIIPTHNRLGLLKKAIVSVLNQTYQDFEVIIVDDGVLERSESLVISLDDSRVKYIQHEKERGGSIARNTGIRSANGDFIAFLDDDDEWVPEKLELQMKSFESTADDVGFCFSAVFNTNNQKESTTKVPDGIGNYHKLALSSFSNFLTVTLIIKRKVFDDVGLFDENLPSHQEAELMIRVTEKFKGLGINKPLVHVNMGDSHDQIGKNLSKQIIGRKILLEKHYQKFKIYPHILATHYFRLGIFYRDNSQFLQAQKTFFKTFRIWHKPRYLAHYLSMFFNGYFYNIFRSTK